MITFKPHETGNFLAAEHGQCRVKLKLQPGFYVASERPFADHGLQGSKQVTVYQAVRVQTDVRAEGVKLLNGKPHDEVSVVIPRDSLILREVGDNGRWVAITPETEKASPPLRVTYKEVAKGLLAEINLNHAFATICDPEMQQRLLADWPADERKVAHEADARYMGDRGLLLTAVPA